MTTTQFHLQLQLKGCRQSENRRCQTSRNKTFTSPITTVKSKPIQSISELTDNFLQLKTHSITHHPKSAGAFSNSRRVSETSTCTRLSIESTSQKNLSFKNHSIYSTNTPSILSKQQYARWYYSQYSARRRLCTAKSNRRRSQRVQTAKEIKPTSSVAADEKDPQIIVIVSDTESPRSNVFSNADNYSHTSKETIIQTSSNLSFQRSHTTISDIALSASSSTSSSFVENDMSFSDWNSKVQDLTLTYNGGKPVEWTDSVNTFFTNHVDNDTNVTRYETCMLFQKGGFGDILLALKSEISKIDARKLHPAGYGIVSNRVLTDDLKTKFREINNNHRTEKDTSLVVVKMPRNRLDDKSASKAFKKAKRAYDEIKEAKSPYICTMQDFSEELRTEIYRYYPCDLARMVKDIQKRYSTCQVIPESFLFFWSVQLTEAITILHEHGILHCDIHPENVLVDSDGFLLLHDFGLSKSFNRLHSDDKNVRFSGRARQSAWMKIPKKFREDHKQFALLDAGWWPPELEDASTDNNNFRSMNHTVDWYGLGASLFQLRTGSYPFRQFNELQQLKMLERSGFLQQSCRNNHLTAHFTNFILQLLRERITNRLGMMGDGREVFNHACFRTSFMFQGCEDWHQRRERVQLRHIPAPYRLKWGWSDMTLRQESQLPRLT